MFASASARARPAIRSLYLIASGTKSRCSSENHDTEAPSSTVCWRRRILVLDGAMGTMIQRHRLDGGGFPRRAIQRASARSEGQQRSPRAGPPRRRRRHPPTPTCEAGSDIIETNTFNSTAIAQADYGLESARLRAERRGRPAGAGRRRTSGRRGRPTGRASSPARSGRPIGSSRSRPTSTTRPSGT